MIKDVGVVVVTAGVVAVSGAGVEVWVKGITVVCVNVVVCVVVVVVVAVSTQDVNSTVNKTIMVQRRQIFLMIFFKTLLKKIHLPPNMGREVMKTQ